MLLAPSGTSRNVQVMGGHATGTWKNEGDTERNTPTLAKYMLPRGCKCCQRSIMEAASQMLKAERNNEAQNIHSIYSYLSMNVRLKQFLCFKCQ